MYINHIDKFTDAQAIQDALDAGTLANPYVAMTTAGTPALDYNTLEQTPPAPATMGTWSDDGQGVYTFQITETGDTYWDQPVKIGVLNDVYATQIGETPIDMDVMLYYSDMDIEWTIELQADGASDTPTYGFTNGTPGTWREEGVVTEPHSSSANLEVDWDGEDTFTFQRYTDGSGAALSMTTINPEYPEVSPESE